MRMLNVQGCLKSISRIVCGLLLSLETVAMQYVIKVGPNKGSIEVVVEVPPFVCHPVCLFNYFLAAFFETQHSETYGRWVHDTVHCSGVNLKLYCTHFLYCPVQIG